LRTPYLCSNLERWPGTPLQEFYVRLPLWQLPEQNQLAGIRVFVVEATELVPAVAAPRACGASRPDIFG